MFVAQTRTIVTLPELAAALTRAFRVVWGIEPELIDLAISWGKVIAECGWPGPGQCVWNFNFGNVRGTSPASNYTVLRQAYEFAEPDKLPPGALRIPTPAGAVTPAGKVCYLPSN